MGGFEGCLKDMVRDFGGILRGNEVLGGLRGNGEGFGGFGWVMGRVWGDSDGLGRIWGDSEGMWRGV